MFRHFFIEDLEKKATHFGELLLWVVHKDTTVLFPAYIEDNKKGIIVENAVSYLTLQSVSDFSRPKTIGTFCSCFYTQRSRCVLSVPHSFLHSK